MKLTHISLVVFGLMISASNAFADELNTMVMEELRKIQSETREVYDKLNRRISELSAYRSRVVAESKKRSELENYGVEILRKYAIIINNRYRDELTGKFESGMEISVKDQENISRVLNRYFSSNALSGRVSAGEALRQIEFSIVRLRDMARMHAEPSEENTSELEILAYQLKDSNTKLNRVTDLAKNLGVELVDPAAASVVETKKDDRNIASQKK